VLLMLVVQVESRPYHNTERTSGGPFIPRLKPRGFLALFCNTV